MYVVRLRTEEERSRAEVVVGQVVLPWSGGKAKPAADEAEPAAAAGSPVMEDRAAPPAPRSRADLPRGSSPPTSLRLRMNP